MPTITPTDAALGAVVTDIDLHHPLDAATIAEVRDALVRHEVLFFPKADLSPAEQVRLGGYFGELETHKALDAADGFPQIVEFDTARKAPIAEWWHSDVTCAAQPPMGAMLQMKIVPPTGGATHWASMTAAYDALDDGMKARLEGLTALNRSWWQPVEETSHPVVRTHPESGRKGIFVNWIFTQRINELDEADSRELLDFLFDHAVKPQFTVQHDWQPGDIAFWDNRITQHRVDNDFGDARRCGHRVAINGDTPR